MAKYFRELPPGARCSRCGSQALVSLPSHNARFCRDCYEHFFITAVKRALKRIKHPKDKSIIVAVSGGKDSLVLWEVLSRLGYRTKGIHINLGIGEFSEASRRAVSDFAKERGYSWREYTLKDLFGYTMEEVHRVLRRKICASCGKLKRQFLDMLTLKEGFDTIATGHNLDDEAARLLGNLMGRRMEYVKKQYPYLPSPSPRIPAKIKPLYRLEIREILIYAEIKGIKPVEEECPLSKGATTRKFKKALDLLENEMPGIKRNFLFGYIDNNLPPSWESEYNECEKCGYPTFLTYCNVCNLKRLIEEKLG